MHTEQQIPEVAIVEQQGQYQFVIDMDLASVGGGTGLMDY